MRLSRLSHLVFLGGTGGNWLTVSFVSPVPSVPPENSNIRVVYTCTKKKKKQNWENIDIYKYMTIDIEIIEWLKNQKNDNSSKSCFSVGQVGQVRQSAPPAAFTLSHQKKPSGTGGTEALGHTESTNNALRSWLTRAKNATTLNELEQCLKEFSAGQWTLLDKRDMSDAYTPVVLKLIDKERSNKWQALEQLAMWCWKPASPG